MPRPGYKVKSAMSLKQFIAEFGGEFSEPMKEKLMELESRSFLTRKDISNRFDLKHVEHIQFKSSADSKLKEYAYGQFEVNDGILYFSENCLENTEVMQSPTVASIYSSLKSDNTMYNNGRNLKKIDENNIHFVVDSILETCPEVSQGYLDIIEGMAARANNK